MCPGSSDPFYKVTYYTKWVTHLLGGGWLGDAFAKINKRIKHKPTFFFSILSCPGSSDLQIFNIFALEHDDYTIN